MTKLWLLPAAAVFLAAAAACSSQTTTNDDDTASGIDKDAGYTREGSTYDSTPSPDSGLGELRFQPSNSYSGYDGSHKFVVPVAVYDSAADLKVTADGAMVTPTKLKNPVN